MAAVERYRNLEVGRVWNNGAGIGGTMAGAFLVLAIYPQLGILGAAAGIYRQDGAPAAGSVADVGGGVHWIPWSKMVWPRAIPGQLYRFGRSGGALYLGRPDGRLALLSDASNADHFRDFEPGEFTIHE